MHNQEELSAPKSRSLGSVILLHCAMGFVAAVIGIALYLEQNFSPLLAFGVALLAFVAFISLHKLLDTAHTVATLGTSMPNARKETASSFTPPANHKRDSAPQKVKFPDTTFGTAVNGENTRSTTVAPIDAVSMELLRPSGEMTSDLIAQALKRQLPAFTDTDIPGASTTPSSEEDKNIIHPTEAMIDQIAEELTSIRPDIGTISVDSITRDLEAATRALEDELKATTLEQPAFEDHLEPATQAVPGMQSAAVEREDTVQEEKEAPDAAPNPDVETATDPSVTMAEVVADDLTKNIGNEVETRVEADQPAIEQAEGQPDESDLPDDATLANMDDELGLRNLIKDAISSSQAQLYLQPILGLATRKAESFEVLTHLKNQQGEVLAPSEFLEEAERAGQMPAIDNVMLSRTLTVLRKLRASGAPGTMFCNLSIFSLSDDGVMEALIKALSDEPLSAHRMVIELSQQAYLALNPADRQRLNTLTELGVRLSLDQLTDAGIFMDALKSKMFAFIKVDAAFFLDKLGAGDDALMPAELLSEATLAGVDLIVEKLETGEDLERAIEYGAKYGQGYVFSEPRPVKAELLEDAA